jgi:hypothetical protein
MNGGATEIDRSRYGQTLTETSGTIPTSTSVPSGYSGTSRDIESGDTEYLLGGDTAGVDISGVDAKWTMCFWVNWESSNAGTAFSKYITGTNQRQYQIYIGGSDGSYRDSSIYVSIDGTYIADVTGFDTRTENTAIPIGTWTHVAWISDDVNMSVYINGVYSNDDIDTPFPFSGGIYNGTAPFQIGARGNLDYYADGKFDEMIMFSRTLSVQELKEIIANGIDGTKGGND